MTERDTVLRGFFETELENLEMFRELAAFLASPHIRRGEFEGNTYVLQKLDREHVNLFVHDVPEDYDRGCREGLRLDRRTFWEAFFAEGVRRGYLKSLPLYHDQGALDRDAFGTLCPRGRAEDVQKKEKNR